MRFIVPQGDHTTAYYYKADDFKIDNQRIVLNNRYYCFTKETKTYNVWQRLILLVQHISNKIFSCCSKPNEPKSTSRWNSITSGKRSIYNLHCIEPAETTYNTDSAKTATIVPSTEEKKLESTSLDQSSPRKNITELHTSLTSAKTATIVPSTEEKELESTSSDQSSPRKNITELHTSLTSAKTATIVPSTEEKELESASSDQGSPLENSSESHSHSKELVLPQKPGVDQLKADVSTLPITKTVTLKVSSNPKASSTTNQLDIENQLELLKNQVEQFEYKEDVFNYEHVKNIRCKQGEHIININNTNYLINGDSNWIGFERENSAPTCRNKYHLSLYRNELNIQLAYSLILPIVEYHKIEAFKILSSGQSLIVNPMYLCNGHGKEFVFYIPQDLSHEKIVSFLDDIVTKLKEHNIIPGEYSSCDIPVDGSSGFIYTRSPYNIFNEYTNAILLDIYGFTASEAAQIAEIDIPLKVSYQINSNITNDLSRVISSLPPNLHTVEKKIFLKNEYINIVSRITLMKFNKDISTKLIEILHSSRSYCDKYEIIDFYSEIIDKNKFFNLGSVRRGKWNIHINNMFLKNSLEMAASITSGIYSSYNEKCSDEDIELTSICPTVYYFIKDFYEQKRSWNEIIDKPFLNKESENLFIRNLVKNALREPVTQSRQLEPTYQFDLTEDILNQLIDFYFKEMNLV